jgi:hypothetical protein
MIAGSSLVTFDSGLQSETRRWWIPLPSPRPERRAQARLLVVGPRTHLPARVCLLGVHAYVVNLSQFAMGSTGSKGGFTDPGPCIDGYVDIF